MPRPRSEEIPLELIKRGSNPAVESSSMQTRQQEASQTTLTTAASSSSGGMEGQGASGVGKSSEETSFIGDSDEKSRKAIVETI